MGSNKLSFGMHSSFTSFDYVAYSIDYSIYQQMHLNGYILDMVGCIIAALLKTFLSFLYHLSSNIVFLYM